MRRCFVSELGDRGQAISMRATPRSPGRSAEKITARMLDAIVGRLIRQYVAEGTCVWKDGGLLAENACLDAAQISDLFEGLAPGVLLPFTIELISVRRGVVSVPLGSILMWRQGNVEVQLEV